MSSRASTLLRVLLLTTGIFVSAVASAASSDTNLVAYAEAVVSEVLREAGVASVDGLVPVCFKAEESRARYDFPLQPTGFVRFGIWTKLPRREELRRMPSESWRLRVACLPDEACGSEALMDAAEARGIRMEATPFTSVAEAMAALREGEVDGVLMLARQTPRDLVPLVDLGYQPYFFAVPKGTAAFPALDCAMTRLKVHAQDRLDALALRHFHRKPDANRVRLALTLRTGLVDELPSGQLSGAVVEFVHRFSALDGWAIDVVRCRNYQEAKDYVRSGAVDVLCGVRYSDDPDLCYPHTALGYIRNYLIARPNSAFANGGADWKDARVAVSRGAAGIEQLKATLESLGLSAEMVACDSDEAAWEAYETGRCNLVLTTDSTESSTRDVVHALPPTPYYFCTSVPRRDLRRRIDAASIVLFREEPYVTLKIDRKYFPVPRGFGCVLTMPEKQLVAEMEEQGETLTLVIEGISALPPGVTGLDEVNDHFERALARRIYDRIGLPVRFARGTCSLSDPFTYIWSLEHLWLSLNSGAHSGPKAIRISLQLERDPARVALVRKVLSSISEEEMQNIIYQAVTEGQTRPFMTREQMFYSVAVILLLALLYTLYAYRRIREALGRAEHAARAKTQFLATISHEIRTPLNAIIGFSEHLEGKGDGVSVKDCVQGIRKSSDALLSLINDVLDITKLESGTVDLRAGVCDLGKIISEGAFIFGERARMKGLAFNVAVPDQLPDFRLFGPAIRQVLTNIVGNAFKYTERGGINCALRLVPAGDDRVSLFFRVSDTGCGISEQGLKTIFDPFTRDIAGHGGRVYEGTGLGLPIVKRLVDAMQGTVRVTSRLGEWTTVSVIIPDVELVAPKHPWQMISTEPLPTAERGFEVLHVAVVDDIAMNLKIMKLHLERAGVKAVSTYQDPVLALSELKVMQPDLLLTDMWMPGLNGEQLARRCRESGRLRNMRIVAVSADTDSGATFDMGAFDAIMPKPVTFDRVRACLVETLAARD